MVCGAVATEAVPLHDNGGTCFESGSAAPWNDFAAMYLVAVRTGWFIRLGRINERPSIEYTLYRQPKFPRVYTLDTRSARFGRQSYSHYSVISTAICLHCQERLMRASADLRIRSNRTNPVPQYGEKSTTGRIYKDLGEKKSIFD